jgi:multidrug efflux pump subunit AcrA (membrane-fusion protein)
VIVTQAAETPLPFEYAGRVVGFRNVEVRPRVGGLLLTREYVEGAKVKEGDVLFRIDPATYEVALSLGRGPTAAGAGDAASGRGEFQTDRATLQQCRWHHPRLPVVELGRDASTRVVRGSPGRPRKVKITLA